MYSLDDVLAGRNLVRFEVRNRVELIEVATEPSAIESYTPSTKSYSRSELILAVEDLIEQAWWGNNRHVELTAVISLDDASAEKGRLSERTIGWYCPVSVWGATCTDVHLQADNLAALGVPLP